jgi:hypothetical protein
MAAYVTLLSVEVGQSWSRNSGSFNSWIPEGLSTDSFTYVYHQFTARCPADRVPEKARDERRKILHCEVQGVLGHDAIQFDR